MILPSLQIHRAWWRRLRFLTQTSSAVVVPTMVLSETRGLSLFLVVRGGVQLVERTRCSKHMRSLTGFWILTLEPERLENQPVILRDESGMDSRQTLKLLVVSDVRRRNELLSSKRSR